MSRPIEQAISNLIPRHSGDLPPELIDLARSLLAQSRTKCNTLKAEEEVARTYACANLACERLKTTLNLPPIEPRPPIPPRNYAKLYSYFERELTSRSRPKGTNSAKSTPSKPLPERHAPSKEQSFAPFRQSRTPKKGLKHISRPEKDARIPAWVVPTIRLLCREMETPRAMPHVLAGVESVLCIPPPAGGEVRIEGKLPALIAAVWFFVVVKMRGRKEQGVEGLKRKQKVREVLAGARGEEGVVKRVGTAEEAWRGFGAVEEKEVNAWRKEIIGGEWRGLDWYLNVGEGVGVEGEVEGDESEMENEEELMEEGRSQKQRRDARDRYDYLSEASMKEHAQWETLVRAKLAEMFASGAVEVGTSDEMDTREGCS